MTARDLGITEQDGAYGLTGPVSDPVERMRDRFLVQFLSVQQRGRGSLFYSRLVQRRIRTSAAVMALFSITSATIISHLQQRQLDISPRRAILTDFDMLGVGTIRLRFTLESSLGSVPVEIEVSA